MCLGNSFASHCFGATSAPRCTVRSVSGPRRHSSWLCPVPEPLRYTAGKLLRLPEALVTVIKWPRLHSPASLQPSASFSYKSERSVMKINAEGKTEAFYPDIYFRLHPLKTTTAHTPFPWLGFNDAINEDPALLQWNQAASERMKREARLNTLGTPSLLIYFLLQVKMDREALWSSDSIVRRGVSIISEPDWIN